MCLSVKVVVDRDESMPVLAKRPNQSVPYRLCVGLPKEMCSLRLQTGVSIRETDG